MNEAKRQVAAIQANAHKFKSPVKPIEDNQNPKAIAVIDEIFTRLKAIGSVGNAFKTESEERIIKQEWMLALREEGVTKQSMIDDGIEAFRVKARKSRSTTWFPTIGEFIDMCQGSDSAIDFAKRAYDLFIRRESQIDSVGRMVTAKHAFDLRKMKARDCEKGFIAYYLEYAKNNAIEPLETHLLTETVQLTPEQEKEACRRKLEAQNQFFDEFSSLIADKSENTAKKTIAKGVNSMPKANKKSVTQLEEEKQRQLKAIKAKL